MENMLLLGCFPDFLCWLLVEETVRITKRV